MADDGNPTVIAAIDVGSPRRGNLGWYLTGLPEPDRGPDIDVIADRLTEAIESGHRVALGFEAPLFIPVPAESSLLSHGRPNEGRYPWCAGAGAAVLGLATQQATFVLTKIRDGVSRRITTTCDPNRLRDRQVDLLIWEAMVTGAAKDRTSEDPHVADAKAAVMAFQNHLDADSLVSATRVDGPVISLVGAAIVAAALSDDLSLLTTQCLVVAAPALP